MNYQQFVAILRDKMALILGDSVDVCIHTALKNNGKVRTGLTISDKRINLSPTIYLEEYFKFYENDASIEEIVESITSVYHEVKFEHSWQVHTISHFETIKDKIVYKIIHAPQNNVLLQTLPHVIWLDFAIVFYILFDVDESGSATIPVTNDLLRLWNVSLNEIHLHAKQNTPELLPAVFKPMQVVIEELLGNPSENKVPEGDIMFVLTNSLRSMGASCILYDETLKQIGSFLQENYYILPSSIHEVIIVPESQTLGRNSLNEMVLEVNQTQLESEDILSDHVYYYDIKQDTLT